MISFYYLKNDPFTSREEIKDNLTMESRQQLQDVPLEAK